MATRITSVYNPLLSRIISTKHGNLIYGLPQAADLRNMNKSFTVNQIGKIDRNEENPKIILDETQTKRSVRISVNPMGLKCFIGISEVIEAPRVTWLED